MNNADLYADILEFLVATALLIFFVGCAPLEMYEWIKCGDAGCPEYIYCPIEKKKVEITSISTVCDPYPCNKFLFKSCQDCTTTHKCINGHQWEKHFKEKMR